MGWTKGKLRGARVRRRLKRGDVRKLRVLVRRLELPHRVVRRARVLLSLHKGRTTRAVSERHGMADSKVRATWERYLDRGVDAAVMDHKPPGNRPLLDGAQEQRVVALACSKAPGHRARWTTQLLAEAAVAKGIVPSIGRETIRLILHRHGTKPWLEKNVVRSGTQRRVRSTNGGRASTL